MSEQTENEVVAALAQQALPTIAVVDGVVMKAVREGDRLEVVDAEPYLDNPRRAKGVQGLDTEQAFARYVELHGIAGVTHVYADQGALAFTAVFNEHGHGDVDADVAGWRDWRADFKLEHGRSWLAWTGIDDEWMSQADFLEHLEDRLADVVDPPGTDLQELIGNFAAHKSITFRQATRLQSGAMSVQYDEEVTSAGSRTGAVQVPERLSLGLDPIKGDEPILMTARLRWKLDGATLRVKVKLDKVDETLEAAWGAVVARVVAAVEHPVLEGRA